MTQNEGPGCPQCGAPRSPSNTPSCDCGERTAEALRASRTAEAAAAADFDPLRIRPYVAVGEEDPARTTTDGEEAARPAAGEATPGPAAGTDDSRWAGPVAAAGDSRTAGPVAAGESRAEGPMAAAGGSRAEGPVADGSRTEGTAAGPVAAAGDSRTGGPVAGSSEAEGPTAPAPIAAADGSRTEGPVAAGPVAGADSSPAAGPAAGSGRGRRTRRAVLLCAVGAGVVVVAAAGAASGLFSYAEPTRGEAAPEIRQSVPDVTASRSASPSSAAPAVSSRPPTRSAPPAPPTHTASRTPSPSTPTPRPSHTGSRTASPSPSVTATTTAAPALRRGDTGPAVMDLQVRLAELNLYDDQVDGVYTETVEDAVRRYQQARGIRTDTAGVYGPATRRSLESETW